MYRYWPTASPLAHEELVDLLLTPLYAAAADVPVFLTQPRELEEAASRKALRKLDEGFVCPATLDARVEGFVRQHFTAFELPPPLADHLIAAAPPKMRPFTPLAMRQYVCGDRTRDSGVPPRPLPPHTLTLLSSSPFSCVGLHVRRYISLSSTSPEGEELERFGLLNLMYEKCVCGGRTGDGRAPRPLPRHTRSLLSVPRVSRVLDPRTQVAVRTHCHGDTVSW